MKNPFLTPSFEENPLTQEREILSQKIQTFVFLFLYIALDAAKY